MEHAFDVRVLHLVLVPKIYFFAYGHLIAPAAFSEKAIPPLLNYFCTFVKNQLGICVNLFLAYYLMALS